MSDPVSKTTIRRTSMTDGLVNRFGVVCVQCRGAGEQSIGPRVDNCQRCGGYRYVFLFWPRPAERQASPI